MPQLSTLSASESVPRLQQDQQTGLLPRTRGGDLKRRLTFEEKLVILDPSSNAETTQERLMAFMDVFAFRITGGIITKAGGGPSDWAALRGPIEPEQVARHLLADRLLPIFNPQWVGSRSPSSTCLVGLDVDADRSTEPILGVDGIKEILAFGYSDLKAFGRDRDAARKRAEKKVSFAARCLLLEDALRRLGPNPDNPQEVLKQPTPSGGLHYYVFLKCPYFLTQVYPLLTQAGLRHSPGQIEFFPSLNRALRLPFGHVPGQVNDSQAWIRFIDNFLDGQIRRFSLEEMYNGLSTNPVRSKSDGPFLNDPGRLKVRRDKPKIQDRSSALGSPKAGRIDPGPEVDESTPQESDLDLYRRLVNVGCTSLHEAEELFRLGILETGTRNSALKQLATHFIWGLHKTAEEAAEILTNWALDPRHESKDIRDDLARGTNKVANQIQDMCRWYAREKRARRTAPQPESDPRDCFAPAELATLVPVIQSLPVEERADQARFFLSILAYAKRNGKTREDGSGWEVAVAIKEVVRKWEGCRGRSKYLDRMDRAYVSGLLVMIREKLQVAWGKGLARTYLLAIPPVDHSEWTICRVDALARLTTPGSHDQATLRPMAPSDEGFVNDERTIDSARHSGQRQHESPDPRPIHPGDTGGCVGPCTPQCPPESAPAQAVPHRGVEAIPAIPASVTTGPDESNAGTIEPVKSAHRHDDLPLSMAGPAARDIPSIRQLLCDSQFPLRMQGILAKPMNKLSQKETRLLLDLRIRSAKGTLDVRAAWAQPRSTISRPPRSSVPRSGRSPIASRSPSG